MSEKLKKRTEPKVVDVKSQIVARDIQQRSTEGDLLARMRDYSELQAKVRALRDEIDVLQEELEIVLLDEITQREDIRLVLETWIAATTKSDEELYYPAVDQALADDPLN